MCFNIFLVIIKGLKIVLRYRLLVYDEMQLENCLYQKELSACTLKSTNIRVHMCIVETSTMVKLSFLIIDCRFIVRRRYTIYYCMYQEWWQYSGTCFFILWIIIYYCNIYKLWSNNSTYKMEWSVSSINKELSACSLTPTQTDNFFHQCTSNFCYLKYAVDV